MAIRNDKAKVCSAYECYQNNNLIIIIESEMCIFTEQYLLYKPIHMTTIVFFPVRKFCLDLNRSNSSTVLKTDFELYIDTFVVKRNILCL